MMGKFGWWYPPGAANDPTAPYNQVDPPEEYEVKLATARCYDCDEYLEGYAEDVGMDLWREHEGHDTMVETYTEVRRLNEDGEYEVVEGEQD